MEQDPLDYAIAQLKARSAEPVPLNSELEELVMSTRPAYAKRSAVTWVLLTLVAGGALCGGVLAAAGGIQPLAKLLGISVEYTDSDGNEMKIDGTLDGNQLLNEQGEPIPELEAVRVENLDKSDVFIMRGRKEDVERVKSIEVAD